MGQQENAVVAAIADSVYLNGKIYTVNEAQPWAEAMAIQDDRLIFVGSSDAARKFIGPLTSVIDLEQRMVMPGIHDAHTHLLWASMHMKCDCCFAAEETIDSIIAKLKLYGQRRKKCEWLVGGFFYYTFFPDKKPHRHWLDRHFPDTPVYLKEMTFHQVLLNTKGLEVVGIDKDTPDPEGGEIVKDEHGELTGELLESATTLATACLPVETMETKIAALRTAVALNNQYGITSLQDAGTTFDGLKGLVALDRNNELTVNIAAHLTWGSPQFGEMPNEALEALIEDRASYQTQRVKTNFVKMTLDGVPTPPYFTEAGIDDDGQVELARILIPPAKLNEMVTRFDQQGIRVKMHVTGAGAARVALDAIEAARTANPRSPITHDLAHTNLISAQDKPRFKKLNAIGEMSPSVWHQFGRTLGDPPQPSWEFKSMLDHEVLMTAGSDWVVTPSPNLFPGLQGMLQRDEQSIDLISALRMLTINGAFAVGWQDRQGSLEAGKFANFIVLDRNLFEVPVSDIGETRVLKTIFEGRVVYAADTACAV